ncbi:MAG: sigma-70 family RNA polymerase sigma factor [Prolixibacteraceae bacterium]|jgi:RNA polymerase sigma-70 factor (ECF subfamily)|nr:sigma-70 family RNA polymerase sigma factor [Prolixibacteraceae bacterium]
MEEELKIWEKIRNGDTMALKVLHDRYYYQLYLFGKKLCDNRSVLDEVVSDCFIKLWTKRNDLVIERSVKSYLFLMLHNGLIDVLRRKDHTLYLEEGAMPDLPDEGMHSELDLYARLYKALEKLPDQRCRILELAVFESCSYAGIAEKLNISVNTVKTQMGRAYRFLKNELDPKSLQLLFILKALNKKC